MGSQRFFPLFVSVGNSVQDLSSAVKPRALDKGVALAGLRASTAGCSLIALEVSEGEVMRKDESEAISLSQSLCDMAAVLVGGRKHQEGPTGARAQCSRKVATGGAKGVLTVPA